MPEWRYITDDLKNVINDTSQHHDHLVEMMAYLDRRYSGLGTRPGPPNWPAGQKYTPLSHWLTFPIPDALGDMRYTDAIGYFTDADVHPSRVIFLSRSSPPDPMTSGWRKIRIEMIGVDYNVFPNEQDWTNNGQQWTEDFRTVILRLSANGNPMGGALDDDIVVTATRPLRVNSEHKHLQILFTDTPGWLAHNDTIDFHQTATDVYISLTLKS